MDMNKGAGEKVLKVLYIEDNDQNFYLVDYILRSSGYEVLRAHDGPEGLDLVTKYDADLILLDIQLPGMDGYTIACELRKNPALSKTPIIALTSYAMAEDRERALRSGCTEHIEKPINPNTFKAQIEKVLERSSEGEKR
ncbi:MAG: response regulator [Methanomassiliicoccales archaeon]|jgi:CheY-like chemotaxis protein